MLKITTVIALFITTALAQAAPTNLGTFKAWTAWQGTDENGKICFISASPDKSEPTQINGKPINRDPPHFLIIHRDKAPAINPDGTAAKDKNGNPVFKKVRNEVQTLIGYPFSKDQRPSASIDGRSFTMLAENSSAWLADAADEGSFLAAMKAGSLLVVKGTSARGTNTTDTYSLSGVTAAMDAIDKACS